jgi:methanol metabolism-related c-type cytochrome
MRKTVKRTMNDYCKYGLFLALLGCAFLISSGAQGSSGDASMAEDKPYNIDDQGRIDWYTFSGYRRYHAECHVCHGPAGLGSSFAPNLLDSVKQLGYEGYLDKVVNGVVNVSTAVQSRMPAFATNVNVMCFVDDIYAYLVARVDGVLGQGRPAKKQPKPEAARERDNACLGG